MASPPSIQRFYSDDYKDAPTWFKNNFLNTLNLFVFPTYNALNKNMTVGDNLDQAYETISVTGGAAATDNTASFLNPIQGNPNGLSVINVQVTGSPTQVYPTATVQAFFTFDGTSINIGSIVGLTNGVSYDITLKVE
jgi:hypothetical protein